MGARESRKSFIYSIYLRLNVDRANALYLYIVDMHLWDRSIDIYIFQTRRQVVAGKIFDTNKYDNISLFRCPGETLLAFLGRFLRAGREEGSASPLEHSCGNVCEIAWGCSIFRSSFFPYFCYDRMNTTNKRIFLRREILCDTLIFEQIRWLEKLWIIDR